MNEEQSRAVEAARFYSVHAQDYQCETTIPKDEMVAWRHIRALLEVVEALQAEITVLGQHLASCEGADERGIDGL